MKTFLVALAIVVLTAAAGGVWATTAGAAGLLGPLGATNTHPLAIATGAPRHTSARPTDNVAITVTHSSTHLVRSSAEWDFIVDVETTTAEVRLEKTVAAGRAAIMLSIPLVMHGSGVLDRPLDSFHSAFGLPDYGRSSRPDNSFAYDVSKNSASVIDGRAGRAGLGDVTAGVKLALIDSDPAISVLATIELPTGDADAGFGSGDLGGYAAMLVDRSFTAAGRPGAIYLNVGYIFPETLRARMDVGLRGRAYGAAGAEWAATERLRLNAEFTAAGAALASTGVCEVDDTAMMLTFGGRYMTGKASCLEFSFSEDPNTAGAPDFAVSIGYGIGF